MTEPSNNTHGPNSTLSDQSFKKRVAQFDYYYDVRTFSYKLRKSAKEKKKSEREHKYAIMIRRQIDSRGQYRGSIIDIKSSRLCDVLLDINKEVEDIELSRTEPQATPQLMYHSYPGLLERLFEEQKKEEKDEALICDIQAGIFYVEEYMKSTLDDVKKMISQREISFDATWALFLPNSLVYAYHAGTDQDTLLVVRRSAYETRRDQSRYLEVICDIIHDDGRGFGFARRVLQIDEYHGTRSITSLSVYPLQYHDDRDGIYSRSIDMGKCLVRLPTHSFREISDQPSSIPRNTVETEPIFENVRVMISPFAYTKFHARIDPTVHRPLKKNGLTDDQYAICSPVVRGYAMSRKTWSEFALTRARDVDWDDGAFEALVLGQKQKKLIHTLVLQHAKQGKGFDDIIRGKGRGLIGLFSGTPGCGKTLTAEAVAEVTHKPLYALSAGELGITPTELETALDRVLELAQMWNAVLLLDEAEVFLTRRDFRDIGRNALVSIFLRRLEYYQGILILTTNMPNNFDFAFQSRIHFSINYPELDFDSRKVIWTMFFKRSATEISDEELHRLASYPINGRQIKNTFSSALTISHAEGSPGSHLKNIDIVLGVLNEWDEATRSVPRVDWEGGLLD